MIKDYREFPLNIKNQAYHIYPRKKTILVNGYKYYNLKDLKKIDLNIRLSFPHDLFVAIDKA